MKSPIAHRFTPRLVRRPERGFWSRLPLLSLGTALLATAACTGDDATAPPDQGQELAALMDDGKLPDTMRAPTAPPPVPTRTCFGGGSGGFGGGAPPPNDGGAGGGSMPPPKGPFPPPTGAGGATPTGPAVTVGAPMPPPLPPPPVGTGGAAFDAGIPVDAFGGSGGMPGIPDAGFDSFGGSGGAGMVDGGGQGGSDSSCAGVPIGFWRFDDCNPFRTDLFDSSNQGHPAFRGVDVACTADQQSGQAVAFSAAEDLVYAPDQPDFALGDGVTIASWIKPDKLSGVRTLFRKRDGDTSAFALILNGSNLQFIVRLQSGLLASIQTPVGKAGKWIHVAATYDNKTVRLYLNGKEAVHGKLTGKLSRGAGPLLMGNDISGRRFQGAMDNVWFNTLAAPATTINEQTCLHNDPTMTVSPAVGPSVQAGTPVAYHVAITNHNSASCPASPFDAFVNFPDGFTSTETSFPEPVVGGQTATADFSVTSGDETDPGTYPLTFQSFSRDGTKGSASATAQYVVAQPTGCHVTSSRELTIRDVSVVDDPIRTSMVGPAGDPRVGAWTFGRLMERLSPSAAVAPDVTLAMFQTFMSGQTINGFFVQPRPAMEPVVLAPWRARSMGGPLSMADAPMRLLAIVNRLDLKDLAKGKAGEGRLVFGVLGEGGRSLQFTVIFEYLLPATTEAEYRVWTNRFHALGALPFPSEAYNAALQEITDNFSGRNAIPGKPNGSALIDIRTNEIELSFIWELREFHLSPTTGFLDPAPVFNTPDASFNFGDAVGRFVNANEAAVLAETHEVPLSFEGAPFLAGSIFNNGMDVWFSPTITNPEARHKFSLNTCNGCHGGETQTGFLQISPRELGQPSFLSGFLTGEDVSDRFTGQPRHFNELGRRRQLLQSVVCAP